MNNVEIEVELKKASTNINKNVAELMTINNISIEELSQKTGITRQSIYHTLYDTKLVSFKKVIAFSLFFKVSIDELMKPNNN